MIASMSRDSVKKRSRSSSALLAVGDVASHRDHEQTLFRLHQADAHLDGECRPVFTLMQSIRNDRTDLAGRHLFPEEGDVFQVESQLVVPHAQPEQFFARVAQAVAGVLIDVDQTAFLVVNDKAFHLFHDATESLLALTQRFFDPVAVFLSALALRDVGRHAERADHPAVFIEEGEAETMPQTMEPSL